MKTWIYSALKGEVHTAFEKQKIKGKEINIIMMAGV